MPRGPRAVILAAKMIVLRYKRAGRIEFLVF